MLDNPKLAIARGLVTVVFIFLCGVAIGFIWGWASYRDSQPHGSVNAPGASTATLPPSPAP